MTAPFNLDPNPDSPPADQDQKAAGGYSLHLSKQRLWGLGIISLILLMGVGILVSNLAAKSESKSEIASASNGNLSTGGSAKAVPTARSVTPTVPPSPTADPSIKVFITGEVQKPGVYQMHSGDRIIDAIQLAGGFGEQADQTKLDLAQRVKDEMRIEVPRLVATAPAATVVVGPISPPAIAVPPTATATPGDGKINVNTASAAELDKLPGIGATLSQRIVEYRTKNGPFKSIDDLRKVTGITKSVADKIKDLIIF